MLFDELPEVDLCKSVRCYVGTNYDTLVDEGKIRYIVCKLSNGFFLDTNLTEWLCAIPVKEEVWQLGNL